MSDKPSPSRGEIVRLLIVRYGIQPPYIAGMTLQLINELLTDCDDGTVTLADTAALHRFMANAGM